jgi:DNA-binding Lrp family transcriptional regulator
MEWSFLTNHARVLVYVAQHTDSRLRDIADAVGITERAAHRIVSELVETGYLLKQRVGRRNFYELQTKLPLPGGPDRKQEIGEILDVLIREKSGKKG